MNRPTSLLAVLGLTTFLAAGVLGCGSDNVSSDEQAELAYLGLDQAVEKSLALGFAGFNTASSANISAQNGTGAATGALIVTGQVDQGSSSNKGMRLRVGMTDYSDGPVRLPEDGDKSTPYSISYATSTDTTAQPELTLSLRNFPTGTFTGTLIGAFHMQGELEGDVALDLTMSGELESDGSGGTRRKAGTTHVTGTAVSGEGEYHVDVTI
ncbi:hypothetical protein FGE12_14610 [Aggregicoccus sp. 17bor-14]|uniref:hypothetical protein n=1 Tax=Myxococcaceae TaxID=31 RepID=UPI00129C8AA5|nr:MULTISPECIES: hypothetical protein [Myxococcaceae]MBF5043625.1 hypothetical protein [Simulacricoccus sp. 17bor-14]MRI89384.1 hypothetical protein [Aggregicoccus sp. 17bor-14]